VQVLYFLLLHLGVTQYLKKKIIEVSSLGHALFVWLISHQSAVLFSQNKPATSNQPAVLLSQNKTTPDTRHQPRTGVNLHQREITPATENCT
jgi:hypothetical protein